MPRYTYLLVDLAEGTVKGTDDAEDLQKFRGEENFIIIVTTGDQAYLPPGSLDDPEDVLPLYDFDGGSEPDDDEPADSDD